MIALLIETTWCWRLPPSLNDLSQDAQRDLLRSDRAEIQPGGIFESCDLFLCEIRLIQILENSARPFFARNQRDIRRFGLERGDEHVFIIIAVTGDDDMRALRDFHA